MNDLEPVAETDGAGNRIATFVYADRSNTPSYLLKGGKVYRVIADHLGSVRMVADVTDGTIAQRLDYDAWGNVTADTTPGFQPFGFAGGLYDPDTGLVRFGARDYDPETGRWTTKDPIGFVGGSTNVFTYVANNPVAYLDPIGLFTIVAGGGVSAAAPSGAEVSAGIVINPGLSGQKADVGVFAAVGASAGLNVSADAFIGVVTGDTSNVSGQTVNQNFGLGPVSLTIIHDPKTGKIIGGTLGVGPGATPLAYSIAYESTGIFTLRDLLDEPFDNSGEASCRAP